MRVRHLLCGAVVLLLLSAVCRGQEELPGMGRRGEEADKVPRLNVDFTAGWGGCYRPSEWTPIEVGVTCNMKDPVSATLSVSAQQDSLSVLNITHPIVLQKDHNLNLPLVTKLAQGASTFEASIVDDRRRTLWAPSYPLADFGGGARSMTALGVNDALIGLAGRRGFKIALLGNATVAATGEGRGRVYLKDKLPHYLPWDWTGYASLDLLILYDPEWDKINAQQGRAIAQWVSNGGRLLLIMGTRPLPVGGPIAEMLPLTIGMPQKLSFRGAELPFPTPGVRATRGARSTARGPAPSPAPAEANTVPVWTLADVRDKSWSLARFGLEPVLASGQVGFGRAGVLLFDPDELPAPLAPQAERFWVWALQGLTGERKIELGEPPPDPRYNSAYGGPGPYLGNGPAMSTEASQATNRVLEHLLQIPELRPLSIWWVIGLLTLLALLLGPVDYLVLKRLDRLPMTWVTSSVLIALFTAGAYYGVQALRAGSTQVRSVTVTDGIAGGPAWATSYSGIFASSSDDYTLEGLGGNQWWSGIAPTREEDPYSYRRSDELSTRRIYCKQLDGGNLPYSLPISIWSMQCLVAEWPVAQMPFSAEVSVDGNEVSVEIDNKSRSHIRELWVQFAQGFADLDEVPAISKTTMRAPIYFTSTGPHRLEAKFWGYQGECGAMARAVLSQGTRQRTLGVESYLQRQAAVVYAVYDDAPCCCQVADAKMNTNHVQLVRLVVWPKRAESQ